jgi:hypothetical protein
MGDIGEQPKVRTYRITPRGEERLVQQVSEFKRLLSGIARVMRPAES